MTVFAGNLMFALHSGLEEVYCEALRGTADEGDQLPRAGILPMMNTLCEESQ